MFSIVVVSAWLISWHPQVDFFSTESHFLTSRNVVAKTKLMKKNYDSLMYVSERTSAFHVKYKWNFSS